ncbi:DUF6415 family natural product biosynthesis protein [Streptomyces sp. TRM64462]|uniref:DUF6415 family natural product biosynthesis protein n=1 Tax=Streptomyces sp. TRM64462 TaxID=2741726 RepID=UPI0015868FE8|nr:DUF6415 family natural product biosynthesis protein [Streptomyces sp. TRM64462]
MTTAHPPLFPAVPLPTDTSPPGCGVALSLVAQDVDLALRLASLRPTGENADALRERLRGHIRAYADAAGTYAHGLADGRARDISLSTVGHARAVAADPVHDPVANLRLLAKAAQILARYAAAQRGAR